MPSAFLLAFVTRFAGFIPAFMLSLVPFKKHDKMAASLLSFTGGILISFVCFEMLPEAFTLAPLYVCVLGVLAGIVVFAGLEGLSSSLTLRFAPPGSDKMYRAAFMAAVGLCLHSIPEGMSIGSLAALSPETARRMSLLFALHCVPEGIAILVPLGKTGTGKAKMLGLTALLSLPMGLGSAAGYAAMMLSKSMSALFLSFAGGVMIYLTCGEIIPEGRTLWKGRTTTVAACLGFAAGIIITRLL